MTPECASRGRSPLLVIARARCARCSSSISSSLRTYATTSAAAMGGLVSEGVVTLAVSDAMSHCAGGGRPGEVGRGVNVFEVVVTSEFSRRGYACWRCCLG